MFSWSMPLLVLHPSFICSTGNFGRDRSKINKIKFTIKPIKPLIPISMSQLQGGEGSLNILKPSEIEMFKLGAMGVVNAFGTDT